MVEHRSPKPGVGSSSLSSRANIFEMKKIVAYLKETYDELVHKVSWPTYSELTNSAVVVLYHLLRDVNQKQPLGTGYMYSATSAFLSA